MNEETKPGLSAEYIFMRNKWLYHTPGISLDKCVDGLVSEYTTALQQENQRLREELKFTFQSKESECESLRNNLTEVMNHPTKNK